MQQRAAIGGSCQCLIAVANISCAFPSLLPGIKQAIDHGAIARPLLDFVEAAAVRQERIVGFLVGPIAHCWAVSGRRARIAACAAMRDPTQL